MKQFSLLFILSLLLWNCKNERLLPNSIVDDYLVQRNETELDKWIQDSIIKPYGIAVEYRWNSNTVPKGTYTYPPNPKNVKSVLRAIKYLWLETYELPNIGKKDFMKEKTPIVIRLYGGNNKDARGVDLLDNPDATGAEMHIYNVDGFNPKNKDDVFLLMRSVHHQFAKKLTEIIPYDRDAFLAISKNKYFWSTKEISDVKLGFSNPIDLFKLSNLANKKGFYTMYGTISPEDDFAEIISATITHTPRQLSDAEVNAKTPYQDYGSDSSVQEQYNENAKEAYREFIAKKRFVDDYFQNKIKINLKRLQLVSLQRFQIFIDKH